MSLSPSRSFKNFADSPINRPNLNWTLSYATLRSVIPISFFLLLGASTYFYAKIFSQATFSTVESSSLDIASGAAYFSKQWLHTQVKQFSTGPIDFHPGVSSTTISKVDPFSVHTGINVWDLYPPQLSCPDVMRIGKIGEGGKWVCGLSQLSNDLTCVMYSFGISTDISLEVEILQRTNCIIHAFDPTVGNLPVNNWNALTEQQRNRIYFHKTALGIYSGTSEMHSLNEQLLDIMHRLGHTFINLLKVDIEGGEWSVFNNLFENGVHSDSNRQPSSEALPVGQLLIELHYHTMEDTEAFFVGAARNGLLPFSREINLQPCLSGGKPLAVEYSLIHVDHYFNSANAFKTVPVAHTPEWHKPIKAVIYYLTQRSRVAMLSVALHSLYGNFCKDYPSYPVLIFHDDLRSSDERTLLAAVPLLQLKFVKITLSTPVEVVRSGVHIPERTTCAPDSSTLGYRHMCRFHATGVHQYLEELGYGQYEYVMRMDDDGLLSSPVGYDLFRYMKVNEKQYGFVNMVADDPACVIDLWEKSELFYNTTSLRSNTERPLFPQWPKGVVFYNNFEISALSLWKDPSWRAYMAYIDKTAGIYTHRWGDAPLHTIGVSMLLSRKQIHAFTDIAYRHSPFVNQVPKGLPMPKMDPFVGPDVECRYYDKWMCYHVAASQNFSMNATVNGSSSVAALMTNFSMQSLQVSLAHLQALHSNVHDLVAPTAGVATSANPKLSSASLLGEVGQTALFTFGHGGREHLLANTLQSFYDNYLAFHPTQIVVFHSDRGSFDVNKVQQVLSTSPVLPLATFKLVTLPDVGAFPVKTECASSSAEVRASSFFFRTEAASVLKSLGFSWIFRFGDDARLNKPVHFNIFEHLHSEGKRFGYLSHLDDRPECVDDLHDLARSLCHLLHGDAIVNATSASSAGPRHQHRQRNLRSSHKRGAPAKSTSSDTRELSPIFEPGTGTAAASLSDQPCSSLFQSWPHRRVMLTNFEVSHVSVWESSICRKLFAAASGKDTNNDIPLFLWGDSALHTLCVVMSLGAGDVIRLKDIEYHFNWTTAKHIHSHDPCDHSAHYMSQTVAAYDRAFAAQRVGWLGGDVAASVALPSEVDDRLPPQKLLWLFGDSIVGVSSKDRRIKEFSTMVSNTVGIATFAEEKIRACDTPTPLAVPRPIEHTAYFWKTDPAASGGAPQPVFTIPPQNGCAPTDQRLWPIAGVTFVPPSSSTAGTWDAARVKLIVLVDVVCLHEGEAAEALGFGEYDTALMVVHNPLDMPNTWRYEFKLFANPAAGKLKWIALSNSKGSAFARPGEDVYLLGAFQPAARTGTAGHQVLGKISAEKLLKMDFTALQLLSSPSASATGPAATTGAGTGAEWHAVYGSSTSAGATTTAFIPKSLFGPLLSEASLHFDASTQEWVVVSLLPVRRHIEFCRTRDILAPASSPWNCTFVAEVASQWVDRSDLLTYAAKAHPHLLSTPSTCMNSQNTIQTATDSSAFSVDAKQTVDLIVSYVSNAVENTDILYHPEYKEAYSPKFVRITHIL